MGTQELKNITRCLVSAIVQVVSRGKLCKKEQLYFLQLQNLTLPGETKNEEKRDNRKVTQ